MVVVGDVKGWVELEGVILSGQREAASLQADLRLNLRHLDPGAGRAAGHVRRRPRDEVRDKVAADVWGL